jgi:hypothetical protein
MRGVLFYGAPFTDVFNDYIKNFDQISETLSYEPLSRQVWELPWEQWQVIFHGPFIW